MKKDELTIDTVQATYAWVRKAAGFGKQPKYAPNDTHCGWCNKSQTEILNEHIEEHDKD